MAVKGTLSEYRRKRDFKKTREPEGKKAPSSGLPRFVIQKHQASRLHYDLRLEMEGVLRSWAVPKGPSLVSHEKRLAVLVEDHPLEYGDFEGVIPEGEYGAGQVIIWDRGFYEYAGGEKDAIQGWKKGKLEFVLHGEKLKGLWMLVEMKGRGENQWLFFKKDDEYADSQRDILEEAPESVVSGRRVEEVLEGESSTWNSTLLRILEELKPPRAKIAGQIKPMLTTASSHVPEGSHWIYEMKYDGIRALCAKGHDLQLYSRNLLPLNRRFPEIVEELQLLSANSFILDGEIAVLDEEGRPRFHLIQPRIHQTDAGVVRRLQEESPAFYFVFDLLACEGYDLRKLPLSERKRILEVLLPEGRLVRFAQSIDGKGKEFLDLACNRGLEGIIAKDSRCPYESKRSPRWVKVKCNQSELFVIGGYSAPSGSRRRFGALLLGRFQGGKLRFVGKTGTGFDSASIEEVFAQLKRLEQEKMPFHEVPGVLKRSNWVKPELVCSVKFSEWTQAGVLRAPVFQGLRPGIDAESCRMQAPDEVVPEPNDGGEPTKDNGQELNFLSNLEKVFWPEEGYTKGDLIDYYASVAEVLLPHLRDRPMVMERHPDGIKGKSFYQKDVPDFLPDWIPTVAVTASTSGRSMRYLVCNDKRTLLYLANLGCIALHPWSSRSPKLDNPDFLIIDLDPDEGIDFSEVRKLALRVREIADELGLQCFPKTSGASGIHVLFPLEPVHSYEEVRGFAEVLARMTAQGREKIASLERSPSKRKGKIYVDYLQNGRDKTIVSPYSVRARPGAPVSTPLEWSELKRKISPAQFNIENIPDRLKKKGDLFGVLFQEKQDLRRVLERLETPPE
jgi:bifunctional non-homologous end joining protein LigD